MSLFWLLKYVCTQFIRAPWPEGSLDQKPDSVENRSVDVKKSKLQMTEFPTGHQSQVATTNNYKKVSLSDYVPFL